MPAPSGTGSPAESGIAGDGILQVGRWRGCDITAALNTRLGRLPFDTLKVDLSLIGPPPASDANRILKAMIAPARALGLQVVAVQPASASI